MPGIGFLGFEFFDCPDWLASIKTHSSNANRYRGWSPHFYPVKQRRRGGAKVVPGNLKLCVQFRDRWARVGFSHSISHLVPVGAGDDDDSEAT